MLVYPVAVRDDASILSKFSLSLTNQAISNAILLCFINIILAIFAQVPIIILLYPKVGELHASTLNTSAC
jgi:hypothetical protein